MNRLVGLGVLLVAVVVGFFALYPATAKRGVVMVILNAEVLRLKYWHHVSDAEQSLESIAFAKLVTLSVGDQTTDDHAAKRKAMDDSGDIFPLNPRVIMLQSNISRPDGTVLHAVWLIPEGQSNSSTTILYFHGGGYSTGSLRSHAGPTTELAYRSEAKLLFLEYRLAPEHLLPAPVDDAVAAYQWLVYDQKVSADSIVLAGDSAGGGLVLLTLLALQEEDKGTIPMPRAAVTLSAWTDLSGSHDSVQTNKDRDVFCSVKDLLAMSGYALDAKPEDTAARRSHKVSPMFAPAEKLAKLPPLYMSVGSAEILLDDTTHFAGKARQAGTDVTLKVVPHMQHVFPLFHAWVPEADQELTNIANYIKSSRK